MTMHRAPLAALLGMALSLCACVNTADSIQRPVPGDHADGGTTTPPPTNTCVSDPDRPGSVVCNWECTTQANGTLSCRKSEYDTPGGGPGVWTCTDKGEFTECTSSSPDAPSSAPGWTCQRNDQGKIVCISNSPDEPGPGDVPGGGGGGGGGAGDDRTWDCVYDDTGAVTCVSRPNLDGGTVPPGSDAGTYTPPHQDGGTVPDNHESNCADGIDNDGDGLVDCHDPDCPACPPATCPPGQECCDGIDNNGDGRIDEGDVCRDIPNGSCPPGAYQACDCYCGVHRRCQADGTWGPCKVDGDGSCAIAAVTTQSQCPWPLYCDYGQCTFGLILGQCQSHSDCPVGQICDLGQCVVDPYFPCP
jgi:hypothetical protein